MNTHMHRNKRNQRGIALLLAVFALFIVTSIGLAMMYAADSETVINSNYRDEQTAYYAANAGLEEARDRMRFASGSGITLSSNLPTVKPGAAGGVLYVLNPKGTETVAPWTNTNAYFDDEICKEVNCGSGLVPPTTGWYVNPAPTASSTYAANPVLPYKWMRITLKINQSAAGSSNVMYVDGNSANASNYVCWNGTNEVTSATACTLPNIPVYLITTLAVTPSGTRRMLQYEVTHPAINFTVPAALTLDGTGDVMSAPTSTPYKMQGTDNAGCGSPATSASTPAIAVNDAADKATVVAAIPSNKATNYSGSGGTTPDVEAITMPAALQTVASLQALVATIESNANQILQGPVTSIPNPGTATSPQIIVVNGDLSLNSNAASGYGLLLVTGTFSACGTTGWNGIVMVIGKGIVSGCGGGSNQFTGAMVVAQIVNPITGQPLSALGVPTFNWSGGGGNGIFYSSGCINQASNLYAYKIIASHELLD